MDARSTWILCVADSNTRLNYIGRALRRAGYNVSMSSSTHKAVVMAAIADHFDAVVIDEDLTVAEESVADSIKAVKPMPVLLICDGGPSRTLPHDVDLVTANGSRQQIVAGGEKLLNATGASARLAS